jgi:hypothetical protein
MPPHDMMDSKWVRLLKPDGHLGALFNPSRNVVRFIDSRGTVDYSLAKFIQHATEKQEQAAPVTE